MNFLRNIFERFSIVVGKKGYKCLSLIKLNNLSKEDRSILDAVSSYTMTSSERILSLVTAIRDLQQKSIQGDLVECGVWRGGSMLAAALTLDLLNNHDRDLYLFDTFSGMTMPTEEDVDISGIDAADLLNKEERSEKSNIWCLAGIAEVKKTMAKSCYPEDQIHYVAGDVLDTLIDNAPAKIALLRLDTDWYESTKHELEVLFPRLVTGGVLIIDDYGHWKGAKKAVDEYFVKNNISINLHKIDYTGRISVKR